MESSIFRIGFWSAIVAAIGAIAFVISTLLQAGGVTDYFQASMIGYGTSLIIPVPFLLAMLVLHHTVSEEKKFWTTGALLFGVMYAIYVIQNYVVQLVTVAPAWLQGTLSQISVLNQTPHSFFWDLDALGYIFQSLAFLITYPAFGKRGLENWLRFFFMANGVNAPLIAIIYFNPTFSIWLPIILGIPWAITVPGSMFLLALFFRKQV